MLFDHPNPFLLAHGGFQIQIQQTKNALEQISVDVEFLRWWDDAQHGDIIHFFGRPSSQYLQLAHQKKIRVVMAPLHGGLGARGARARAVQRFLKRALETFAPKTFISSFAWESYRTMDACVVLTPWEKHLVETMFNASPARVHVVPNGVEPEFFNAPPASRGQWLVTTGSILPVKRIVETAEAAVAAATPFWVIGKPFSETEPYYQKFVRLCEEHPAVLRYDGGVDGRDALARIYREARGFVLLSQWESLSISALEAAACESPLLLSDLGWARSVFAEHARYCSISNSRAETARRLREFYDAAPRLTPPLKPLTWPQVAQRLRAIYEKLLA